ncbi:MAG: chromosomal replication initiator protein DnaA [Candidatus Omnitrophica bacterium]|nr:chromosomal replication initiator protein DnaA [Candidatus Omnitrophota bacterium]
MEQAHSKIWDKALVSLKDSINQQTYETWLLPMRLVGVGEESITLGVPNKFFKNWVEEHYSDVIERSIETSGNKKLAVELVILTDEGPRKESAENGQAPDNRVEGPAPDEPKKHIFPFFFKKALPSEETKLNPKYTFESFVVGPGNRFAHAAALAISESPAKAYNPLFIYGKVGLGKTHLMQAIGHHILKNKQNIKCIYITSEKFTNQLINAIQNRTTLKFRQMYRNVDLLLIDDIHFIAGKEATQEEFFHTFNTLYDAHNQIVVSSDRSPKDIAALEERLVSRFEWGLVTDIQPPDVETRIAILRQKAEREGVAAPDDVTFFIAEKIKTNIRELEGALIRVAAYAKLVGRDINLELVREVLKDLLKESEKKITIELIQQKVAHYFDIRVSDLRNKRRTRTIVYPRQIAMYLSRDLTDSSLPEIGEQFGGRDHSTVIHAYEKIERDINSSDDTKNMVEKIKESIKG